MLAITHTGREPYLIELLPSSIHEQKIRRGVTGLKEIQISIFVNISCDNTEGLAQRLQNPGLLADIGKSAIPFIAVQVAGHWRQNRWETVRGLRFGQTLDLSTVGICGPTGSQTGIVRKLAYEEIQAGVIVIVEPYCTRGPPRSRKTARSGNFSKGLVAAVAIQNRLAVPG